MVKFLTDAGWYFPEVENGQQFLSCTTNRTNTLTPLVLEGGSQIAIPNNTAINFDIKIGGRGTSGTNSARVNAYRLTGIAKNINGVASIVSSGGLGGGVQRVVEVEEVNAWNAVVVTSGTNLSFQVSGDTGTVVLWKAEVQLLIF